MSEVKEATDNSPYAAGARSSEHVTVVSPDTVYDYTIGKFNISAAWTEYILEQYGVSDEDANEIRPLLFRELYQRQRGYDETFIPEGGNKNANIRDFVLHQWVRSQPSSDNDGIAP